MNVRGSRFPVVECPCGGGPVVEVLLRMKREQVNAEPSPDGTIRLRDTGAQFPVADWLTAAQQFGKQGQLHTKHVCVRQRATPVVYAA